MLKQANSISLRQSWKNREPFPVKVEPTRFDPIAQTRIAVGHRDGQLAAAAAALNNSCCCPLPLVQRGQQLVSLGRGQQLIALTGGEQLATKPRQSLALCHSHLTLGFPKWYIDLCTGAFLYAPYRFLLISFQFWGGGSAVMLLNRLVRQCYLTALEEGWYQVWALKPTVKVTRGLLYIKPPKHLWFIWPCA